MTRTIAQQHVGLRVSDLERSTRFYEEALGGHAKTHLDLDSEAVSVLFGAAPGTTARVRFITFDQGAVEIFEFSSAGPTGPVDQTSAGIMHLCMRVDDVARAVSRAEALGGRALFSIRDTPGNGHFVYVEDPDGVVIELVDFTVEEAIGYVNAGASGF